MQPEPTHCTRVLLHTYFTIHFFLHIFLIKIITIINNNHCKIIPWSNDMLYVLIISYVYTSIHRYISIMYTVCYLKLMLLLIIFLTYTQKATF